MLSPELTALLDAVRRIVENADVCMGLGPPPPTDLRALLVAYDAWALGARDRARKWGALEDGDEYSGCLACGARFENDEDVSVCHECEHYVHVRCFLRHLGGCTRRRN